MGKLAVLGIGGNSIIKDKNHHAVSDQYDTIRETAVHIADLVEAGYDLVITHGNGPQVGFILRRSEIAYQHEGMHHVPLDSCVADTQGAIGYQIQLALGNEFRIRKIKREVVSLVTQVRVRKNDPDYANPSKPIGTFYQKEELTDLLRDHPDWKVVEDAGRGFRRVVPSPLPLEVVELQAIKTMADMGFVVIASGGGGIPVVDVGKGMLKGVEAVVDKDLSTALLANSLGAELLLFSTGVEQVYLNFGKADQKALDSVSPKELVAYAEDGHFVAGSMLPKVNAVLEFMAEGGKEAVITTPQCLLKAVRGEAGTRIFL